MYKDSNKLLNTCKFCLLIFFITYYGSITLFYHSHLVNGHFIIHSHPFQNAPEKSIPFGKHQHSSKAFIFFDQLNKINCEEASFISPLPKAILICLEIIDSPYFLEFLLPSFHSLKIRGPPFYSFSI